MNKFNLLTIAAMLSALAFAGETRSQINGGTQENIISEPVDVQTPTAILYGTLERPKTRSRVPIVLIIAGSGPTDRDGNSTIAMGQNKRGQTDSLKLLADGLAAKGIASVRYDKRAIGETGKAMQAAAEKTKTRIGEADLRFENYIDDAVEWCKKLRMDRRFSSLTVLGHSEGSLIGMVAAERSGADAYVSVAGPGRNIQQILLEQMKPQLPPDLYKTMCDILDHLAAAKTVETFPPTLSSLFRPTVQPYMISWLKYDPAKEIAKLQIPVLIVQGTTDIQVSLRDAKALATANPAATLLLIEGMNHVFKLVSDDRSKQIASYGDPTLPVAPALVNGVIKFVFSSNRKKAS